MFLWSICRSVFVAVYSRRIRRRYQSRGYGLCIFNLRSNCAGMNTIHLLISFPFLISNLFCPLLPHKKNDMARYLYISKDKILYVYLYEKLEPDVVYIHLTRQSNWNARSDFLLCCIIMNHHLNSLRKWNVLINLILCSFFLPSLLPMSFDV